MPLAGVPFAPQDGTPGGRAGGVAKGPPPGWASDSQIGE